MVKIINVAWQWAKWQVQNGKQIYNGAQNKK